MLLFEIGLMDGWLGSVFDESFGFGRKDVVVVIESWGCNSHCRSYRSDGGLVELPEVNVVLEGVGGSFGGIYVF